MAVHNQEVANTFLKLANLLEIEGDNPFRIRAYRNAARTISNLSLDLNDYLNKGKELTDLPGIGEDLSEKIQIILKTGELPLLKKIEARTPAILNELMKIEGLGPKRVKLLYQKLGIKRIQDLKSAIEKGRLKQLPGFGEKIEQKIWNGLQHITEYSKRIKLAEAVPLVDALTRYLKKLATVKFIECAGSFRRRKETVGDLDFLVAAHNQEAIIQKFVTFEEVADVLSQGTTRASVHLHSGIQVDLRVIAPQEFSAALLYFTGSKEHNIALRKIALQKKLKLNEYGLFRGNERLPCSNEKAIYRALGLDYIEPELREDRGEIIAAKKHQLPSLIKLSDIRGDLHCHTHATDGNASLQQMIRAAQALGYEYIAITDHSQHLTVAHGLDKKAILAQIKSIDKLNSTLNDFRILKSMEIDILEDGTLDMPEEVLKELDLTVCSIHSKFNLSQKKQTERVLRAMDNPYFTILAHPTGRLINHREPYAIDVERIIRGAKERGCVLELNAQPDRLDLNDVYCKMAKEIGAKMVISSDAHSPEQFSVMQYGIYQARRGWLEKGDVLNTLSLKALLKGLKRSRNSN